MLVITESSFTVSNWYEEIIFGLRAEARRKRDNLVILNGANCFKKYCDECVCLVGSTYSWLKQMAVAAQQANLHPIVLTNQRFDYFVGKCSCVSADISLSVAKIIQLFSDNNKDRVALYGINENSVSDICKYDTFCSIKSSQDVFFNRGSLNDCFLSFKDKYSEQNYNAVLCANDYAAVSLMHHLKHNNIGIDKLSIISYSNSALSKFISPTVSSVFYNNKSFGKAAFSIKDSLFKIIDCTGIHINIDFEIILRETTKNFVQTASYCDYNNISGIEDDFYKDDELKKILSIDKVLTHSDETDLQIIKSLCKKETYSSITENCYLTENALKYRIKKMKEICEISSTGQLIDFFEEYNIKF